MGYRQYQPRSYEYPQVHPPVSQPHSRTQISRLPAVQTRFSWMDAPSDPRDLGSTTYVQRQSRIPPLPVIPDHLNVNIQHQQQETQSQPQPQPEKEQEPATPQQLSPSPEYTLQDQMRLQELVGHKHQFYQETPPTGQQKTEAPPLPKKHSYTADKPKMPIEPDENPLSPGHPKSTLPSGLQANNMNFLPPPNISTFPSDNMTQSSPVSQGGTWQHSLCSCAEPSTCMTSIFCPCIIYGRTQHRLNLKSEKKDPTNMLGYSTVNGSCATWAVLCGINIFLTAIQHTRIRKRYELDGSAGNVTSDCLKSMCCCCCMLAQDEKEVRRREEECRRVGESSKRNEGYNPPRAMSFSAPVPPS